MKIRQTVQSLILRQRWTDVISTGGVLSSLRKSWLQSKTAESISPNNEHSCSWRDKCFIGYSFGMENIILFGTLETSSQVFEVSMQEVKFKHSVTTA
jgi:hypothetical protein